MGERQEADNRIQYTRKRIAHSNQVVKYFAVDGRNWGLSGSRDGLNGICLEKTNKKKSNVKDRPSNPEDGAPSRRNLRAPVFHFIVSNIPIACLLYLLQRHAWV